MSQSTFNPLLNVRIPGGRFQLPSGGLFYENGELSNDVINGELEIFPMTSYDEILIRSPDLLLTGVAIERVFKRCIPQVLKPLELFSKDVDFLLICLRSISFGSSMTLIHNHGCSVDVENHETKQIESIQCKDYEYDISIDDFVSRTKQIDSTTINSEYMCKIQDKLVYLTPIRYSTVISILSVDMEQFNNLPQEEAAKKMYEQTTQQLSQLILKIVIPSSGSQLEDICVTDVNQIHEWIKTLSPKDIRELNLNIDKSSSWGPEMTYKLKCKHCNEPIALEVPLNPMHFFM